MKAFVAFVFFLCFAFPAFSQSANVQRFRALGDAMAATHARNTEALADFDSRINDDGSMQRFAFFLRQHSDLSRALSQSEFRLNFLLNGNAHRTVVSEEHENFTELLSALDELRTEYDAWLRTVQ